MSGAFYCPECEEPFGSLEGCAMHMLNKEDEQHADHSVKWRCKMVAHRHNAEGSAEEIPPGAGSTDSEPLDMGETEPVEATIIDEPAIDEPATDEPAIDEPATDEPAIDAATDGGEYQLPEWPEGDRDGDPGSMSQSDNNVRCCDDPQIETGEGRVFKIGPDTAVKLAEDDEFCTNCDTLNP